LAEFLHFLSALELSTVLAVARPETLPWRNGTWGPAAYLLPLSLGAVLWSKYRRFESRKWFAVGLLVTCLVLVALFHQLPRYTAPGWLGITRPTLMLVAPLWACVGYACWRLRNEDRFAQTLAFFAVIAIPGNLIMLYSGAAADAPAMLAHVGKLFGGLFLFFSLTEMAMRTHRAG
jgi:hypothetical protein